jgi:hypothetical protein
MLFGKGKGIRGDNMVAAGALGLVHGHVCAPQQAIDSVAALPFSNAKTACDCRNAYLGEAKILD